MTMSVKARLASGLALSAILSAGAAQAETIRATSGFGPAHPIAVSIYPALNEKLKELTQGAWELQDTPSGLVAPNEMSSGLRDGVTEFGALLMPYFPAEFPDSALPSELSILGSNNLVVSAAVTEYLVKCADCQAEFSRNGQVYLGSDATPPYDILSTTAIRSVEDMKGKRIRTGSPFYANYVAALGAEAAQIPSSELFESLSQGVITGTVSGAHEIIANRLGDVIKFVIETNQGIFNGAASTTASRMLWDRMSPEDRAHLTLASQYGLVNGLHGFMADAAKAREVEGIEFIAVDDSLKSATEAFNLAHMEKAASVLEGRGVKNAAEKIETYKSLIEKWEKLITPEMTAAEMAELRYKEIFGSVDLARYGQ